MIMMIMMMMMMDNNRMVDKNFLYPDSVHIWAIKVQFKYLMLSQAYFQLWRVHNVSFLLYLVNLEMGKYIICKPFKTWLPIFRSHLQCIKFFLKSDHIRMVDVKGDNYQSPNHNFFVSGAPNDDFLVNTLKTLFRQLRVRLDPKKCILSGAIKFVSVRSS